MRKQCVPGLLPREGLGTRLVNNMFRIQQEGSKLNGEHVIFSERVKQQININYKI